MKRLWIVAMCVMSCGGNNRVGSVTPSDGQDEMTSPANDMSVADAAVGNPVAKTCGAKTACPTASLNTFTPANLIYPGALAADGSGNVYVSDGVGQIGKVVPGTSANTVIAGGGTFMAGSFGDGVGTAAFIENVSAMTTDGAGNLYVLESAPAAVRKINVATGAVTTIAGTYSNGAACGYADGIGTAAAFCSPAGIAYSPDGALYIADSGNYVLRKMVLGTGAVTTFAGSHDAIAADGVGTAASFVELNGLTFVGGNLYTAAGTTIRQINTSTAAVSTIAGTQNVYGHKDGVGTAAIFYEATSITSDGADSLYVTDYRSNTVRKILLGTNAVSTVIGAPGVEADNDGDAVTARIDFPIGLTFSAGNLVLNESVDNALHQILLGTACADTRTDPYNCGACNYVCGTNQTCVAGACAGNCSADTENDASNCGACGTVCPGGQVCSHSACIADTTCGYGLYACNGACVDLKTDNNNCGACGSVCANGTCPDNCN